LHGVLKRNLKATVRADSLAACGDVNRNAMLGASAPDDGVYDETLRWVQAVSDHLTPRTAAYHEIWLDKKQVGGGSPLEEEPIYGKTYLPRKFKIAFAIPPNNDVDVLAHDLGFVAITERIPNTGSPMEEGEANNSHIMPSKQASLPLDSSDSHPLDSEGVEDDESGDAGAAASSVPMEETKDDGDTETE